MSKLSKKSFSSYGCSSLKKIENKAKRIKQLDDPRWVISSIFFTAESAGIKLRLKVAN